LIKAIYVQIIMDFSLITALWAFWSRGELQEKPYNCAKNLSSVVSYSRVALPASSHPLKELAFRSPESFSSKWM
jgi:hypothetical protein